MFAVIYVTMVYVNSFIQVVKRSFLIVNKRRGSALKCQSEAKNSEYIRQIQYKSYTIQ